MSAAQALADLLRPERALIFRITHRDNVAHILEHGLHCRNSSIFDPNFVEIGHPDIIGRRKARTVDAAPYGTLADYIPFYFTPRTPMLHNIVTGWNGLRQRSRTEIVVLVSSLKRLEDAGVPCVVSDRNATLVTASLQSGRTLLKALPWAGWQASDYRHDPDKPDKVERYQAETLVHRHLPASLLAGIVTFDGDTRQRITQLVAQTGLVTPVSRRPTWYP